MKRVLTVALFLILIICASAEEEYCMEYEDGLAELMGINGEFVSLPQYGIKFFLPSTLINVELYNDGMTTGKVALFVTTEMISALAIRAVSRYDENGAWIAGASELIPICQNNGAERTSAARINSMPGVLAWYPESELVEVTLFRGDFLISFLFTGFDSNFTELLASSICPD